MLEALEPHLEPDGTAEEQAPVRNAYRYLNNRLDCLDYPGALALGLPIGSGLIESGHRHVLPARLKKPGTAWLRDHAGQIAHLRVLRANHQWESMWNYSPTFNHTSTPCASSPSLTPPQVVEKILRHLGAWHDPPAIPPPSGGSGPYTYEPCDDVDPMPDCENVLAD